MFVCCAALLCFTLVCDCIFLLSCHVFFVVLPVSFVVISPFCLFSVSSYLLTFSRLVLAWPRLLLICHMMSYFALVDIGCLFALLFRSVSFESFSVDPFFFHASLLYESPRRKPGWRFTAGSPCDNWVKNVNFFTFHCSNIDDLRPKPKTLRYQLTRTVVRYSNAQLFEGQNWSVNSCKSAKLSEFLKNLKISSPTS